MYRAVEELNQNELEELRDTLNYKLLDSGEDVKCITDNMVFKHFEGIHFVEDDFLCNQ